MADHQWITQNKYKNTTKNVIELLAYFSLNNYEEK